MYTKQIKFNETKNHRPTGKLLTVDAPQYDTVEEAIEQVDAEKLLKWINYMARVSATRNFGDD